MTIAVIAQARRASLAPSLALVIVSLLASVAQADDTQPVGDATSTPPAAATATPPPTGPAGSDPSLQLGPIERLPFSGYPNEPVRGIPQGSLKLTMQGLQFPYYPKTGIAVSGYSWVDTGYEAINRGNANESSNRFFVQQAQLVLRVTPTLSDGRWFVQTQAEIVANEQQDEPAPTVINTYDLWIKAGLWKVFDVQVGRFESWEIYHRGMGLDRYTLEYNGATDTNLSVPQIYGVSYAEFFPDEAGAAAVHLYPASFLRFELLGRYGQDTGGNNLYAVRPAGILDLGLFKFKVGAEYLETMPQAVGQLGYLKQQGAGAGLQFILDPYFEAGINGAYGQQRESMAGNVQAAASFDTFSVGAFANVRIVKNLLIGGGVDYTYLQDKQYDSTLGRDQNFDHWQVFGAIQYVLWNRLYIKNVLGYALADFNVNEGAIPFENTMYSERLRVEYLF